MGKAGQACSPRGIDASTERVLPGTRYGWNANPNGWKIVVAGACVQALTAGLFVQAYGIYVVLLRQEFGWSRTMLSAGFSLVRAESGLLAPLHGWLADRIGTRTLFRYGVCGLGAGLLLLSTVRSQVAFLACLVCVALGGSLAGFLTITTTVVNWFRAHRALALSLVGLGMAVGGLLVPLTAAYLEAFGWRVGAATSGALVIAVGLPLAGLIHHRPADIGLRVQDLDPPVAPVRGRVRVTKSDLSAREAMHTGAFWFIAVGHACAVFVVSALLVHLVPHVTGSLGYPLQTGGFVVAVMTTAQLVGVLVGGFAGDRLDKRLISFTCMCGHGAAVALLAFASSLTVVMAAAALHGLAWGTRGPLMQAIRADYFGASSFGTIMGFSSLVVLLGNTTGPVVAGAVYDASGSYRGAFLLLASVALAGALTFLLVKQPQNME